jgi:cobalt-zinc-cadmium efflux system outer membrane protein
VAPPSPDAEVRLWALRTEAAVVVARLSAAQARLDAAQAHARDVERLIEILRARERDGEGSRFDRLRAEQELRDLRQIATAAAVDAGDARARVIGMLPAGAALARVLPRSGPRVAPIPASSDTLTARAVAIRGELRSLQRSAERAGLESTAARRTQFPVPTVFGGVKRAGFAGEGDRGGLIGVSLSLPLFDNGDREAARWSAERLRVDAERTSIEQEIRAEVAAAYAALSLRQTALADEPEGAGDELVRIADVAYREGEAGILELLDAVRIASRARVRGIELRLDERLSEIALERAVGEVLWP